MIPICGRTGEVCPAFIGKEKQRPHIGFEDPSEATGTDEFIWSEFRRVRDEIREAFWKFYQEEIQKEAG